MQILHYGSQYSVGLICTINLLHTKTLTKSGMLYWYTSLGKYEENMFATCLFLITSHELNKSKTNPRLWHCYSHSKHHIANKWEAVRPLRFKIEKIVLEFNANSTYCKISLEIRILKMSKRLRDNMISKSHLHNILTKCSTKIIFPNVNFVIKNFCYSLKTESSKISRTLLALQINEMTLKFLKWSNPYGTKFNSREGYTMFIWLQKHSIYKP